MEEASQRPKEPPMESELSENEVERTINLFDMMKLQFNQFSESQETLKCEYKNVLQVTCVKQKKI